MKQRMAIAAALLGDPEVLVLDEPTNGLDPQGIAEIRGLIREVAASGKTILITSHLLDEVEKVCTHVAVIKNGNLLAQGMSMRYWEMNNCWRSHLLTRQGWKLQLEQLHCSVRSDESGLFSGWFAGGYGRLFAE